MLLLSSSAHHIYWLGRDLFRIGHVASHLPFCDDEQAADFALIANQFWIGVVYACYISGTVRM